MLHVCVMYAVVTGNVSACVYGRVRRGPVTGETGHDEGDRCERGEHSIAKNNTHRRSAAHTDLHFCQQDPIQMEPAYRNTASARAYGGVEVERNGSRKAEGTNEVICCCLAVSNETCARFADTYAWTTEILT